MDSRLRGPSVQSNGGAFSNLGVRFLELATPGSGNGQAFDRNPVPVGDSLLRPTSHLSISPRPPSHSDSNLSETSPSLVASNSYIHIGYTDSGLDARMTQPPGTAATGSPTADGPLTSAQFHILLTLADGSRHGYGIMQEVERRTDGAVELGPGTLYRSIKQLLARGLIVEIDEDVGDPGDRGRQRRSYVLTPEGKARTVEEAQRLRALVQWAQEAMVLEGGNP